MLLDCFYTVSSLTWVQGWKALQCNTWVTWYVGGVVGTCCLCSLFMQSFMGFLGVFFFSSYVLISSRLCFCFVFLQQYSPLHLAGFKLLHIIWPRHLFLFFLNLEKLLVGIVYGLHIQIHHVPHRALAQRWSFRCILQHLCEGFIGSAGGIGHVGIRVRVTELGDDCVSSDE